VSDNTREERRGRQADGEESCVVTEGDEGCRIRLLREVFCRRL